MGWVLLVIGIAFLIGALNALVADARGGVEITMGGAMHYSGLWLVGAINTVAGLTVLLDLAWWWALGLLLAIYFSKHIFSRVIVSYQLGADLQSPPGQGFKEFSRRTDNDQSEKRSE